jgi:hypothetical protein
MKSNLLRFTKIKITASFVICIILLGFIFVCGNHYHKEIISYQGQVPIIDGKIDSKEEQGTGKPTKITLASNPFLLPFEEIDILVGTSHSNDSYLYINTVVNYNNIISGNISYQMRLNGTDEDYDVKRVSSITNSSIDLRKLAGGVGFFNDLICGGTIDSEGKCIITNKFISFELRMPFNSGDFEGRDLNIHIGDVIEIYFHIDFYYEKNIDDIKYRDFNSAKNVLVIQNTTAAPLSIVGIILGLVLIISVNVRRKKLKKNKFSINE